MVITCTQCQTQFRLDDDKVGPRGLRVRCSRCQHAFSVLREQGAPRAPAADPVPAGEVPQPPEAQAPSARESSAPPSDGAAGSAAEDSWSFELPERQFNFERRAPVRLDEPLDDESVASPSPAPAAEPDLGAPESWDFVSGAPAIGPEESSAQSSSAAGEAQLVAAPAASVAAPLFPEIPPSPPEERPERSDGDAARRRSSRLARLHGAAAWTGTAALCIWGVALAVWPARIETRPLPVELSIAGLALRVESTRYVENASAGPLLVMSGELRNPGPARESGPVLALVLEDAGGRPLPGSETPLGPPIAESDLREDPAASLLERQWRGARALSQKPLRPGERGRFDAVVVAPPAESRSWRIRELAQWPQAAPAESAPGLRPGASPP